MIVSPGFAGGLHDKDLGLVRFGWRDYDPLTSRWPAPDPIGDAGGDPDWYGYCLDDPVNQSDPTGLVAPLALLAMGKMGATGLAAAGTFLAGLAADGAAKVAGKNSDDPLKATKGSMKAMGGAAAINAGTTAGAVAGAGAAKTAPAVATNVALHPYKIVAGMDFASGFLDPGPPPQTPGGAAGGLTRKSLEELQEEWRKRR